MYTALLEAFGSYVWSIIFYCLKKINYFIISIVKSTRCTNVSNLFYFGMTLYMFQMVFLSIISSSRLYIQLSNRYCSLLARKQTAVSV